jgi:hypothetical protein
MSALVEVLYPLPDLRRTPLTTIRWWESRRPLYNKVVGATGLFTMANAALIGPPNGPDLGTMLQIAMAYAVVANVCYSMGWGLELLAKLVWGRRAPDLGPLLFREGLIFSVGLTLLPVLPMTFFQLARLVGAILGLSWS